MLGGTGTKNLNLLKTQDGAGLEKTYSTHYFIWDWHEKALFTENVSQDWYKKSSFNSKC